MNVGVGALSVAIFFISTSGCGGQAFDTSGPRGGKAEAPQGTDVQVKRLSFDELIEEPLLELRCPKVGCVAVVSADQDNLAKVSVVTPLGERELYQGTRFLTPGKLVYLWLGPADKVRLGADYHGPMMGEVEIRFRMMTDDEAQLHLSQPLVPKHSLLLANTTPSPAELEKLTASGTLGGGLEVEGIDPKPYVSSGGTNGYTLETAKAEPLTRFDWLSLASTELGIGIVRLHYDGRETHFCGPHSTSHAWTEEELHVHLSCEAYQVPEAPDFKIQGIDLALTPQR